MSGRIGLLGIVLALQLVVTGWLLLRDATVEAGGGPLLEFAADTVDAMELADGDGGRTVLAYREGAWQLDSGHPADSVRVTELLDRLAGLQAAWPVATTLSASERFEVTAERHQRHVRLLADGQVIAEAFFGTSPGYQRVHARRAGDEAVHSVALSNFQVPVGADEWLDRTLLQPRGQIIELEHAGAWSLSRDDEGWLLDGAAADQAEAAVLVRRFAELRVTGVLADSAAHLEERAVFRIDDEDGSFRLTVYADAAGDRYAVRSDRRDGVFALAAYVAEQLLVEADRLQGESTQESGEAQ
jgi:hypothetical protein